jgi:hypothetical protein
MSLFADRADYKIHFEIGEWYSFAANVALEGKLSTEKQFQFCEITAKLVLIADEQDPPIDPAPLIKLASLDPAALPGIGSRYALFDAAYLTWWRIRAAWLRSRCAPVETAKKDGSAESLERALATLGKSKRLKDILCYVGKRPNQHISFVNIIKGIDGENKAVPKPKLEALKRRCRELRKRIELGQLHLVIDRTGVRIITSDDSKMSA